LARLTRAFDSMWIRAFDGINLSWMPKAGPSLPGHSPSRDTEVCDQLADPDSEPGWRELQVEQARKMEDA